MSNRIPVDNFGSPLHTKGVGAGLSKHIADSAYLNVSGEDQMASDLDMAGFQISNVQAPDDNTDAVNKAYVDRLVQDAKTALQTEMTQRLRANLQGSMITVRFNVTYLPQNTSQLLGNVDDDSYFIVSVRYKKRDNYWYEGQIDSVMITVKNNTLYIQKKGHLPLYWTGQCEVLFLKGGTVINIRPIIREAIGSEVSMRMETVAD